MTQRTARSYLIVNSAKERLPAPVPFEELREAISILRDEDAYVQLSRKEVLGSRYEPTGSTAGRRAVPLIALDKIERDVRLRIERQRNYRPLVLDEDETLAEPTFYSISPNNVLAVMRNSGAAPSAASFRDYINKLELFTEPIQVISLVDTNKLRALRNVDTLTRFDVEIGPDVAAEVFSDSPLVADAIRMVREQIGHATIELQVKISPKGHTREANSALEQMETLVTGDALTHVKRAEIGFKNLETGRADSFDFLEEAIVTSADVELDPQTQKPTEASASEGIAEAYDKVYDDIQSALHSLS